MNCRGKSVQHISYRLVTCLLLFCIGSPVDSAVTEVSTDTDKAVLVTGASTGIGRMITERLAAEGFFVYAGARKQEDIDALNRIGNVKSVRLDVTIPDEIEAAVKLIDAEGRGLYALVNNAGVLGLGPLIEVDESELNFIFNVNVYGLFRITRAFAPMIVKSKGRIVNISSISGILSPQLSGVYSMSKHAVEAYTDTLDAELLPLGVRVIAIEPGTYDSKIFNNLCDRLAASNSRSDASPFQQDMQAISVECESLPTGDVANNRYSSPERVAEAALQAISAKNPKEHYMVVPNQDEAHATVSKILEELVHLNSNNEFSYSRTELIELLDQELARISQSE